MTKAVSTTIITCIYSFWARSPLVSDSTFLAKSREFAAQCPAFHLRKVARAVTRVFDDMLQPCGIRATQLHILNSVLLADPPTITHVADNLVMDRTTLTRNLQPLDRLGLLTVAPGEDRRTRVLQVTVEGKQVMAEAFAIMEDAREQMERFIGQATVDGLHEHLAKVLEVARRVSSVLAAGPPRGPTASKPSRGSRVGEAAWAIDGLPGIPSQPHTGAIQRD
ncbi:MAG: MarR family winged helix-turn-helix transcriptional regulator [Chloroflexi bacterium]|nr:MarR family winged helix-turn-helix transcriptional regulator [Chloroflexota bacterium]